MLGFNTVRIVDPYGTMGAASQRRERRAAPQRPGVRALPAAVDDGDLAGVPVEDVARAHGLTLDAAARFQRAWNEASRYAGTPRGERAQDELGDIDADSENRKRW